MFRVNPNYVLAAAAVTCVAASCLLLIEAPQEEVGVRGPTRKALRVHLARQAEGARIYSAKTIPPAPVYESQALVKKAERLGSEAVEEANPAADNSGAGEAMATQGNASVSVSPLPPPRPVSLRPPQATLRSGPPAAQRQSNDVVQLAPEPSASPQSDRSFFERIFGLRKSPPDTAMAYANLQESSRIDRRRIESGFAPGVAIYDISARRLYLPNGDQLEAHSGLGEMMDDIRFPHVRMRGVTPPHVYNLTERERPFHGVRAIRPSPVGGAGAVFGRNGLLAHSFMLGGRGDSNGCVSIREYDRFLQAFLRGEIKQLKVVANL